MALKAVVENLDDVPPQFHDEYLERDGKFYLDLDDPTLQQHTSLTRLTNAYERVKASEKAARNELATIRPKVAPEGFDQDEWTRLRELDKKLKDDPNYQGPDNKEELQRTRDTYEQRIRDAATQRQKDLEEKDAIIAGERSAMMRRTIRDDLGVALDRVGVDADLRDGAMALLSGRIKCVRDDETNEYETSVDTDLGPQSVADYINGWSKSPQGKKYVPEPRGGGAKGSEIPGSRDPNPFSSEHWNVTLQGKLINAKGEAAAQALAARVGTYIGGPRPAPRR